MILSTTYGFMKLEIMGYPYPN